MIIIMCLMSRQLPMYYFICLHTPLLVFHNISIYSHNYLQLLKSNNVVVYYCRYTSLNAQFILIETSFQHCCQCYASCRTIVSDIDTSLFEKFQLTQVFKQFFKERSNSIEFLSHTSQQSTMCPAKTAMGFTIAASGKKADIILFYIPQKPISNRFIIKFATTSSQFSLKYFPT